MGCMTSSGFNVVVLVGSLRKKSNTSGIIRYIANQDQKQYHDLSFNLPDLNDIPLYNEDNLTFDSKIISY